MTRPALRHLEKNGAAVPRDGDVGLCTLASDGKDESMGRAEEDDDLVQFTRHGTSDFQTELEAARRRAVRLRPVLARSRPGRAACRP